MSSDPLRERDELVLEALLGDPDARARARERLAREPGGAAELARLADGLARAGASLVRAVPLAPRPEARFVARVLARTTRQDLSWRGDARLLGDFLRTRLRASPLLRVVAASFVLHLVAAPVLAWWILREQVPARRITIQIEQPAEDPFAPPPPVAVPALDELRAAAHRREARENERARQRFVLLARGAQAPRLEIAPGSPSEATRGPELLAARAALLRAGADGDADAVPVTAEPADALGLALWCELELDRLVLTGRSSERLGPACLRLAHLAQDSALVAHAPGSAALVRAALGRALGLGLLERLAEGDASEEPVELLTPAWFAALERAGRESGLGHTAAWAAWLAFGSE